MFYQIITNKKLAWLNSKDCKVKELLSHIRKAGKLRNAQIEAIETYLFLKLSGKNQPLWQLFYDGFFNQKVDLSKLNINQNARDFLSQNQAALALYQFATQKNNKQELAPEIAKSIIQNPQSLDYKAIIKNIFYNVDYADYLMSLPMGAGKTYLMAAFIYLDLYFALNEPNNKLFSHNFLVLIPSGLKSSIAPSLRNISNFNPSWILPEPSASKLKNLLKFEILDQPKTAKKSNKTTNPNAAKINACLPSPFGQVFVVNAEKVILESFDNQQELDFEEKKSRNELKTLLGKIPNLSIFVDEVHHAATSEIKLRQAINDWQKTGNINTVLGFSGTPYLAKPEIIKAENFSFKFSHITNIVYYYPLLLGIENFLKKPTIKIADNLNRLQIIKSGIEDFKSLYQDKIYQDNGIAKLAIYCSSIDVLENEVYPFLTSQLKINPEEILKYHKGNKEHNCPKENELEFRNLDSPSSKKRYILLVQIGKEGWDCKSLTAIILAGTGDSPKNMVLQTSCRCLRQVEQKEETALIWLNKANAQILNQQLKQEHHTNIDEVNNFQKPQENKIARTSRIEHLKLPEIEFYQLKINYPLFYEEENPNTKAKLENLIAQIKEGIFKQIATISATNLENLEGGQIKIAQIENTNNFASYQNWLYQLAKSSFGFLTISQLKEFEEQIKTIFSLITNQKNQQKFFNDNQDIYAIESQIRLAFYQKRNVKTEQEIVPQSAKMLVVEKLTAIEESDKIYPNNQNSQNILQLDEAGKKTESKSEEQISQEYQKMKETLESQGMGGFVVSFESYKKDAKLFQKAEFLQKDQSFHYLPYNFNSASASNFELTTLKLILEKMEVFKEKGLEIYYNGEPHLSEFVINCFAQKTDGNWKNIGKYTPDFLMLKRDANRKIKQILIIETKGKGFASDFENKKQFMESEFLKINQQKFNYNYLGFLYLENTKEEHLLSAITDKINNFFQN
jgi:hypothetical protein